MTVCVCACVLVLHLIFLTHSLLLPPPPPSLLTYFTEIHPLKCKHSYPLYHLVALIHAVAVKSRRTRAEDRTAFWRSSSARCRVWTTDTQRNCATVLPWVLYRIRSEGKPRWFLHGVYARTCNYFSKWVLNCVACNPWHSVTWVSSDRHNCLMWNRCAGALFSYWSFFFLIKGMSSVHIFIIYAQHGLENVASTTSLNVCTWTAFLNVMQAWCVTIHTLAPTQILI